MSFKFTIIRLLRVHVHVCVTTKHVQQLNQLMVVKIGACTCTLYKMSIQLITLTNVHNNHVSIHVHVQYMLHVTMFSMQLWVCVNVSFDIRCGTSSIQC